MSLSTAEELLEQHTLALRSLASDLGAATAASAAELGPRELATGGQRQLCRPPQSDSLCCSCQLEGALIGWYCSRSCPVREGTKHPISVLLSLEVALYCNPMYADNCICYTNNSMHIPFL